MTLLSLGRDRHSAMAAPEEPGEGFWNVLGLNVLRPPRKDGLHVIKQLLRDDGRVFSLVKFTGVLKMSVVEGISQNPPNQVVVDFEAAFESLAALFRENAVVGEKRLHGVQGGLAFHKEFIGALDDRRNLGIDDDRFSRAVVEVAYGSPAREMPHTRLVLKSALGVAGELVAVLLRLNKLVAKIGLPLGRVLKPERREFEIGQIADVEEVDDFAAVLAVAGEAVGVPGDNARSLPRFNPAHHFIENGPSGRVGRFPLRKTANDGELLFGDQPVECLYLARNRKSLLVVAFCGLAGVDEKLGGICFHADIVRHDACLGKQFCAKIPSYFSPHRAAAALRAISLRLVALNFFARAMPPLEAPSAPKAIAIGFFFKCFGLVDMAMNDVEPFTNRHTV